jgi:hypothetical protein
LPIAISSLKKGLHYRQTLLRHGWTALKAGDAAIKTQAQRERIYPAATSGIFLLPATLVAF